MKLDYNWRYCSELSMAEVMCVSVPRNFRSISFEKISFSQWKCERKQNNFSWNSLKFSTFSSKSYFFAKIQSSWCQLEKFRFLMNENFVENFGRKWINFVSSFSQISFKENFDENPKCASVIRNLFAKQYDCFLMLDPFPFPLFLFPRFDPLYSTAKYYKHGNSVTNSISSF